MNEEMMNYIKSLPLEKLKTAIIPKTLIIDWKTREWIDDILCEIIFNYNKINLESLFRTFCRYDFETYAEMSINL